MEKHECKPVQMKHHLKKDEFLDMPERREIFSPEELLQLLPIKISDDILDLGAGTGYLTIPAAHAVDGLVHALDTNPMMLEAIACKADAESLNNIRLIEGSVKSIPLPDSSIDVALASLVLHEVKPLTEVLKQIGRVLKEGGSLLCFDYEAVECPIKAPPMNMRIPSSVMEQELLDSGFTIVKKLFPREYMYVFVAEK